MNPPTRPLRIGTRASLLARTQTNIVIRQLQALYPALEIVVHTIQTTGDARQNVPFAAVGTKGMFVKEIEQALLDNEIDLGVHSMKDMPGEMPLGLEIACIPLREDPRDALITRNGERLADLKPGAVVGTSSLRRQAQLRAARPDLQIAEMRGNLDTRLRKLDSGECDAIALACAGLNRLGMAERISQALDIALCCPAVGQGALALEARSDNDTLKELLNALHHPQTADAIAAERAFLQRLEGGCSIPAGALATVADDLLHIQGVLAAPDGSRILTAQERGSRAQAKEMGRALADALLAKGGADLLKG